MKTRWITTLGLTLVFCVTAANADPIYVDPTTVGSSVDIELTNMSCVVPCTADWEFSEGADGLDGANGEGWLDVGQSLIVDFFDITVGGWGSAEAIVTATLAFLAPDIMPAATGEGSFWTFFGALSAGELIWEQPDWVDLGDGTYLAITFEDLHEWGIGGTTTVSATITRMSAVPEPGTLALLGIGLLALGLARRRRTSKNP